MRSFEIEVFEIYSKFIIRYSVFVMSSLRLITVTCSDSTEAAHIAKTLLDERLVACANVIDGVQSMYYWEGSLRQETEVLVQLKTTTRHVQQVVEIIAELHSYEVPELIVFPISEGLPEYLSWIERETLPE